MKNILALMLLVAVGQVQAGGLEESAARGYGEFAQLMEYRPPRPVPVRPWSIKKLVAKLRQNGTQVRRYYQSKSSNMLGGLERGYGLVTSLGDGEAVMLTGARDAESLRVKPWPCIVSSRYCYLIYKGNSEEEIGGLSDSLRPLHFTMKRNVFFYTESRSLNQAVKKALAR